MTKKRFGTKIVKMAKKIKAVNYKGGKCEICGEKDFFKLCFHHKNPEEKEYRISKLIKDACWPSVVKEIDKCQLLCNNCHIELHTSLYKEQCNFDRNKRVFLEFRGMICETCGYEKCSNVLHFHHQNEEDKNLNISKIRKTFKNILELTKEVEEELNKCVILCSNCHALEHAETEFYTEHKEEILNKVNTLHIYNKKLDRELVKKLYFEDRMRQIDIVKLLGSKRSTISSLITDIKKEK